jgi:hypothetical protein
MPKSAPLKRQTFCYSCIYTGLRVQKFVTSEFPGLS